MQGGGLRFIWQIPPVARASVYPRVAKVSKRRSYVEDDRSITLVIGNRGNDSRIDTFDALNVAH